VGILVSQRPGGIHVARRIRRPTVFVVDDDACVLKSLGRLLRSEGFEVRLFETAEGFLDEAADVPGACAVVDVTMPATHGLDLQRRLRERGVEMPIIVVSARDDDATRHLAKSLGAKFFFRKPVDSRTLIDAIDWVANSSPNPDEDPS
jgi:two-component system response regulator FixJ